MKLIMFENFFCEGRVGLSNLAFDTIQDSEGILAQEIEDEC